MVFSSSPAALLLAAPSLAWLVLLVRGGFSQGANVGPHEHGRGGDRPREPGRGGDRPHDAEPLLGLDGRILSDD